MSKPIPIYIDRSGYIDGLNCRRLRWLSRHFEGRGIQRVIQPHYFQVGTSLHDALEAAIVGEPMGDIVQKIWNFTENPDVNIDWGRGEGAMPPDMAARQAATFIEAALYAWVECRLPYYRKHYEVVSIEQELEFRLGEVACPEITSPCELCAGTGKRPVIWLSRPDVILRRLDDRALKVMDFKSSGFMQNEGELDFYLQHKTLVFAQLEAVEQHYGEPCSGFIYEGVFKGSNRVDKRLEGMKRQYSPLTWAYQSPSDGLTPSKVSHDNWRTGAPTLTSQLATMTLEEYITQLPTDVKESQFMFCDTVSANPVQVERWRQQVLIEEAYWLNLDAAVLASGEAIPQNDDHCTRFKNNPCLMLQACFDEAVRADPILSGFYEHRIPNHQAEKELHDQPTKTEV